MKPIFLFLCICFLASYSALSQVQPTDTDGDGYINIKTLDHLRWVSENVESWSDNYELDNDINAADTRNWNVGDHDKNPNTPDSAMGWNPLGRFSRNTRTYVHFVAVFEGNNFAIDSLYINMPSEGYIAFIGEPMWPCRVSNLGITNCDITGRGCVGGILGFGGSRVENCYSSGNIYAHSMGGGIYGWCFGGTVINCSSSAIITGIPYVENSEGSIRTFDKNNNLDEVCDEVHGFFIGGLCGEIYAGKVYNSYATGTVKGASYIGGFTGRNFFGEIKESFASGDASGEKYVGGFTGINYSCSAKNCYAKGNVLRTSGDSCSFGAFIGGISNFYGDSTISNCYAIGNVKCGDYTNKGFIGGVIDTCALIIMNNFFDSEFSNQDTDSLGSAIGKTTAEMKTKSTFTDVGWDFDTIWHLSESINDGYPCFVNNLEPMNAPLLLLPKDGATDVDRLTEFEWSYIAANSYMIRMGYDREMTVYVKNYTGISDANITFTSSLAANTTYYWQVRADTLVPANWSEIFSFTTGNLLDANVKIEQYKLNIYPNPATNVIYITYAGIIENIKIYDITGNLMLETNIRNIDISALPSGIYQLLLSNGTSIKSKELIIWR